MTVDEIKRRYLRVQVVPDTSLCQARMGLAAGPSVGLELHANQIAAYDEMNDIAKVLCDIIADVISIHEHHRLLAQGLRAQGEELADGEG